MFGVRRGVKFIDNDRSTDLVYVLDLRETLDLLCMANSIVDRCIRKPTSYRHDQFATMWIVGVNLIGTRLR